MAKIFRRAANKVKNSRDGHGSLGLLIFDEKVVYETFQKVIMAKADGELFCYASFLWRWQIGDRFLNVSEIDLPLLEDFVLTDLRSHQGRIQDLKGGRDI